MSELRIHKLSSLPGRTAQAKRRLPRACCETGMGYWNMSITPVLIASGQEQNENVFDFESWLKFREIGI